MGIRTIFGSLGRFNRTEHKGHPHATSGLFSILVHWIPIIIVLIGLDLDLAERDLHHSQSRFLDGNQGTFTFQGNVNERVDLGQGTRILEGEGIAVTVPIGESIID